MLPLSPAADLQQVPCQRCKQPTSSSAAAPALVAALEEQLTQQWMQLHGIMRCPYDDCQAFIERVGSQRGARNSGAGSEEMSEEAGEHLEQHR